MKNLENSALMQEMNLSDVMNVNGGWSLESAAIAGAIASICSPFCPVFIAAAFVVGGFCEF